MSTSTPPWPSLYNPAFELSRFRGRPARLPNGHYLNDADDVFRFTLYWSFIFYLPPFLVCGVYALLNLSFPPARRPHPQARVRQRPTQADPEAHLMLLRPSGRRAKMKTNERRSRVAFALLVLCMYVACGFAGAVVGSLVGGYILAGLFKAAEYNMSTWIPCLFALIQALVGTLGIWPKNLTII